MATGHLRGYLYTVPFNSNQQVVQNQRLWYDAPAHPQAKGLGIPTSCTHHPSLLLASKSPMFSNLLSQPKAALFAAKATVPNLLALTREKSPQWGER